MIRTFVAAIALASLAACSTVPTGPVEQDNALKAFKPVDGKAAVYIYRNEFMAPGIRMDVLINGVEIGSTSAMTYLYAELPPGRHQITSKAEDTHTLTLDAQAGQVAYIWQEVKAGGWYARSKLQLVDAATGQAGVKECRLTVR